MLLDRINDAASSEELFHALTSHTPVGVFVSNAAGACVYVNDRWCELAGLSRDEALGDGWQQALHPDDANRVLDEWAAAADEARDSVVEYRFLHPDGSVALIQGFASALRNDDGTLLGWTGTCLDLTAGARREGQQKAVAEFGLRTLNRTDLEALARDAVETVAVVLGVEYASLLEVQPDGETMLLRAGHGWELPGANLAARVAGDSPAAQALRASGPVLVVHGSQIAADGRGALLTAHNVASSAAMVVRGASRPWGVLAVHSRRGDAFIENDLVFLRAIANVFAAALGRQRGEESARQLAGIVESTPDAIFSRASDGVVTSWNAAAERTYGYTADEMIGRSVDILLPPNRPAEPEEIIERLERGETIEQFETVRVRKDGTWIDVELTAAPIKDAAGRFVGLSAISRDISERKRAEQEQHELAAIVGASDDAIIGTTPGGVVTTWNSGAERMYGYKAEDVVGRPVDFLIPAEKAGELARFFERLHRGERIRQFETMRQRKDGTRVHVALTISPISDATGQMTGVSAIARDITKRKEAEAQLRQSEARYRELFENATDLIATVDVDSCFTDVNRAFAETLGYTREELIGRALSEVVPPEARALLEDAREGKLAHEVESTLYEHELVAKDGHRIEVEVSSRLITHDGEPVGVEAICRDVSERKQLEAQLRQAQKMEAVGNLAGGIAHDFNNLLTVINGSADRALGFDDVAAMKKSLGSVLRAGQSAAALTRQLLAFSRQQVLRPRVLDLTEVLTGAEELLERLLGENVRLQRTVEPDLGNVRVDPNQIEQVLLNLAVNARDAMPNGGSIRIAAGNVDVDAAYASTRAELEPGPYVEVMVSDTGSGMDEETRGHIFEPFFTTKNDGTGLGLATVYGIVKQSGGNITVYSEPGSGTTFRILLPRVDALPEAPPATQALTGELAGTETILIIEDNVLVRDLTAEILDGLGYTIHTAGTADEVIALGSSLLGPLHLVVSDVMLPGLPGPELVALLHQSHPETRCLYTSGYAPSLACLRGGFDSDQPFLAKPFTTIELASLVRKVLDG